ncbi:MAG: FtsX-like permease family protein [Candidatus Acidiferrales bacterium]
MFGRLLWQLLRGNRGRLAVALVAIASGAAVISTLFNMEIDVRRKLTQEFSSLGANLVISRYGAGDQALLDESMIAAFRQPALEGVVAVPYLYVVARTDANHPVVLAGTWLDAAAQLSPTWQIAGSAVASRDDLTHCLVGQNAARQLGASSGSKLVLHYERNVLPCTVAGVISAGSDEDNQVFANLAAVQKLANLPERIELIELRVPGTAQEIRSFASRFVAPFPYLQPRPIRQVAETEGALLGRIQLLIFSMAALILVLTALCVLATMAALAMERRADVGLMKALGGSIGRIVGLFLAEVGVLGAAGGILGYILGAALTLWVGRRVFGAVISPRLEVFPLTVGLMIIVALAGALPLRLLGKVKPATILRGE